MKKKSTYTKLLSDNVLLLLGVSIAVYVLLLYFHGILIYSRDTIETVPYALWLADKSLFPNDFYLQNFNRIFPNERYVISWLLHWFPERIDLASRFFHAGFGIGLVAGMIRLSDLVLKNIEMSVLAVFITLFSLYGINVGGNELYYNMFVPSLAGKAVAVWAIVAFYREKTLLSSILLVGASFLHPLVGLQVFIVLSGIYLILAIQKKTTWKQVVSFITLYILTAGIWIYFLMNPFSMSIYEGVESYDISFFEIVRFRIGHHFFPEYFPTSHIILSALLYVISAIYFIQKKSVFMWFYAISIFGIVVYIIGLSAGWEIVLSSQWMKINIWLKFFSIIGILAFAQSLLEKKFHRILILVVFAGALIIALKQMNPSYDKHKTDDLYTWISVQSSAQDVFLVPPGFTDFKAKTLRNSYFDFKAMLHHKPAIYAWANRFEEIYGLDISEPDIRDNIFTKVRDSYFSTDNINMWGRIDFVVVPKAFNEMKMEKLMASGYELRYADEWYMVYGK